MKTKVYRVFSLFFQNAPNPRPMFALAASDSESPTVLLNVPASLLGVWKPKTPVYRGTESSFLAYYDFRCFVTAQKSSLTSSCLRQGSRMYIKTTHAMMMDVWLRAMRYAKIDGTRNHIPWVYMVLRFYCVVPRLGLVGYKYFSISRLFHSSTQHFRPKSKQWSIMAVLVLLLLPKPREEEDKGVLRSAGGAIHMPNGSEDDMLARRLRISRF